MDWNCINPIIYPIHSFSNTSPRMSSYLLSVYIFIIKIKQCINGELAKKYALFFFNFKFFIKMRSSIFQLPWSMSSLKSILHLLISISQDTLYYFQVSLFSRSLQPSASHTQVCFSCLFSH